MDAAVETWKLVYFERAKKRLLSTLYIYKTVFIRQPNQRQRPTYVAITITSIYGPGPSYIFSPPPPHHHTTTPQHHN